MDILIALREAPEIEFYLVGGDYIKPSAAALGPHAESALAELRLDKVFAGISAISLQAGMTTSNVAEARFKRVVLGCARQVIGLADSSKFGRESFARVAPVSALQTLITTAAAPEDDCRAIERAGVEVVRAPCSLTPPSS